jgi:[acyl-carrier-protein] S-malonyltransferase
MWGALFPGQGSQAVGMGKFLYENFAAAKLAFEEASDALGQDLKKLCFEGPESDLALTENTQPALLTTSTAAFRSLAEICALPIAAGAGHSIGEYAAVVAAGALPLAPAVRAVRARGRAMQRAVPVGEGAMLAVMGLTDEQVARLLAWAKAQGMPGVLEAANFNSPGQVVISGSAAACEWLRANLSPAALAPESPRCKLIPLSVSAPFHCSLMLPAEKEMERVLGEAPFSDSLWEIVQNVTAEPSRQASALRANLVRQVSRPVRWTECVRRLQASGVRKCVEFGAGKVLAGLAKKIDSDNLTIFNTNSIDDLRAIERSARG